MKKTEAARPSGEKRIRDKDEDKEEKKRERKRLKDMNGDGKRNFKDTWLGDALGFDGEFGTKGKPGLMESLKGARREKPKKKEESSNKVSGYKAKSTSKTKETTSTKSKPKAKFTTDPEMGKGPDRSDRLPKPGQAYSGAKDLVKKANTGEEVSYEEWKEMSKSEREKKGLPTSTLGWQWKDVGSSRRKSSGTRGDVGSSRRKSSGTRGMARGGAAQKGDLRKKGLFYHSGSPRGFK